MPAPGWFDTMASGDSDDREQFSAYYAEAFEKAQGDYYAGVNLAAKSVFFGSDDDLVKAMEYAKKVEDIVGTNAYSVDYWKTATVAEILLMQKKSKEAAPMYQEAIKIARTETGSHNPAGNKLCD